MVNVREDLTGKIFTRLTVLKQTEDYIGPDGRRKARWLCECSCEEHNKVVVTGHDLKSGDTKSCGCLRKEAGKYFKKINKSDLSGEFGILWTTNTNEEVYFDLEDAEKVLQHCWYVDISKGYAVARINGKTVLMHTFLGYRWPDHRNRNKLDNRKNNLIPSTQKENNRNMPKKVTNTSGFIGVAWHKAAQKWTAQITVDGKKKHLGCYLNKEDAIVARLHAESKFFGECAPQRHLFEEYGIEREETI